MKNNLLKYYIVAFYLCSTLILCAQPGSDQNGGGLEGDTDTTPATPIDNYLIVLAVIGLIYVFLRVRAYNQLCNTTKE